LKAQLTHHCHFAIASLSLHGKHGVFRQAKLPEKIVHFYPSSSGVFFSAFLHKRVLHSVAFALENEQVPVVSQSVNHRRGHLVIRENGAPFGEFEICGNHKAAALITVSNNAEQKLRAFLVDGDIAPLVKNKQVAALDLAHQSLERAAAPRFGQAHHELGNSQLSLTPDTNLVVIDGQHRIKAMEMYLERIKDNETRERFS
jgi:hypothetical protein